MPLSPLSPNVTLSRGLAEKGAHGDTINGLDIPASSASASMSDCKSLFNLRDPALNMSTSITERQSPQSNTPLVTMGSPRSSQTIRTEISPSTPPKPSPSSNATPIEPSQMSETTPAGPAVQDTNTKPQVSASKRKRVVPIEEKEKERAEKKQKQDEAAAEKARIAAEKETVKATKAAEKAAKAAEKAKVDAAKEAIKKKKEEEELAAKAKSDKQRNLMASFLKKPPTAPPKTVDPPTTAANTDTAGPSLGQKTEPSKSAYELNFKPFFIKSGVSMATPPFEMDDETKEAKSRILDEYVNGDRGPFAPKRPFDPEATFNLTFPRRGVIPPNVKKIMQAIQENSFQSTSNAIDSRSESHTEKLLLNAQNQLSAVPMKYIRFYEDVRPAYFGTITTPMKYHELRALARRPSGKTLPLNYEYDSETEWVEDDGEDLDDAEDEEEDMDGDEEMDDFVDDSEAAPAIMRPGFESDSLPISTGLCFENPKRQTPSTTVQTYRLEFLLDSLDDHSAIDPFSTEYWPASIKKAAAIPATSSAQGTLTSMLPPAVPRDVATVGEVKDGVPQDMLEDFKRALLSDECKDYSKSTVIELLTKKFSNCTKVQVKTTLDTIAHRVTPADATKKSTKIWALLPNFSLKQTM